MPRLSTAERLERAKLARDQADASFREAAALMRRENRRLDTRRKIVLGAAVLRKIAEDPRWKGPWQHLVAALSERDRKLFDGWEPPSPPST